MLLNQFLWAAITGTIAIVLALLAGRIQQLSPTIKVWICRFAFLKLAIGIIPISVTTVAIGTSSSSTFKGSGLWPIYLDFLFMVWLIGVLVVWGNIIASARQTVRFLSKAVLAPDSTRDDVFTIAREIGPGPMPAVLVHDSISFPYAVALGRPVIVLPKNFNVTENRSSVAHEIAHIWHADLRWSLLYRIVASIFWFHPFMFKLESEASLWQESGADRVACQHSESILKSHAHAILSASSSAQFQGPALSSALSGDATTVGRRLKALYSPKSSASLAFVFVAVALAAMIPVTTKAISADTADRRLVRVEASAGSLWTAEPEIASISSR